MAQSSILAPDVTVADSSTITVGANETVKVSLYAQLGSTVPDNANFALYETTPGAPNRIAWLKPNVPLVIAGEGSYYVHRAASGSLVGTGTLVPVGVFKEQG